MPWKNPEDRVAWWKTYRETHNTIRRTRYKHDATYREKALAQVAATRAKRKAAKLAAQQAAAPAGEQSHE
jgi:hypothetical protein